MTRLFVTLAIAVVSAATTPAQSPFQFPTANHALEMRPGQELKFVAPTLPDKPWTSGSFGCVRSDGWQMHEGLDILHLHTDRHGEPTDPVMATADGTVVYVSAQGGAFKLWQVHCHPPPCRRTGNLFSLRPPEPMSSPVLHPRVKVVKAGQVIATMGGIRPTPPVPSSPRTAPTAISS